MKDYGRPAGRDHGGGWGGRLAGSLTVVAVLVMGAPPASASPPPQVTIGDVTVAEGNSGTTTATFTITTSPHPKACCSLQVSWATANGTATAPADYTASSGVVTLSRSVPQQTVTVPVVGDTIDEANETFVVNLSNLVGSPGVIGDAQGVASITDNDPTPGLSVTDVTGAEGDSGTTIAAFTISLSAPSGQTVSVSWATVAGTATAGTDFVAASGSRTFAPGETAKTVNVTVNGDIIDEDDETFMLTLSGPVNATITDGSGLATITDDDAAPTISVDDATVTEGNSGTTTASFTLSLSGASGRSITVNWATAAGTATAGIDYVTTSGSCTFGPGETTKFVSVTVNGDTLDEDDETFTVTLSGPVNAAIADGSGLGTITDDDPLPEASIADASLTEGNAGTSTMSFTVSLSAASGRAVTIHWATSDDDAVSPSDYVAASGDLTFSPGQTSKTVDVTIEGDLIAELDEPFLVTLSAPSNATIGDGQAVGTIIDDEGLPVIDLGPASVLEGNVGPASLVFTVALSHPSATPITVDWATVPGTAAAGTDYLTASGTVTFPPLDTSGSVVVTVNGDGIYERDETLTVQLSNPTNAPIGHAQRIGTILNDDSPPSLSVGDASVVEGNTGTRTLRFTVTLTGGSEVDASVDFATAPGTASAGSDFAAAAGTLTIPAGAGVGTVDVTVQGDLTFEANETFGLTLSAPADATIGDGSATGTITNDDLEPTTITLRAIKKPSAILAKGILEPAKAGEKVTGTLFRKQGSRWVKVKSQAVIVRNLRDRDGDGKTDASYLVSFARPKAAGTYRVVVRFKGTSAYRSCTTSKILMLPAS